MDAASILLTAFAFILGAAIGSFLNVCIYRMPIGLSVNEPRRSFCPHCKTPIAWRHNLPLISWLALCGKCASCGERIPFRYFGVELLTAILFLAVWLTQPWQLFLPFAVLASLLVVATFIDFDHFIIPDEITIGGTIAGLALSFALPQMMGAATHWRALLWSGIGAAVGFALLYAVVELGKLAFGKKRIAFEKNARFTWTRNGDEATLAISETAEESMPWSELFSRESDQLHLFGGDFEIDGEPLTVSSGEPLRFFYNRLVAGGEERALDSLTTIRGTVREIIIPREAMGFGDVKFIACIGAFLGWQSVLFTVVAASIFGAIIGITAIAIGKREVSAKIPFGPYLALGALLWLFFGARILHWYFTLLGVR